MPMLLNMLFFIAIFMVSGFSPYYEREAAAKSSLGMSYVNAEKMPSQSSCAASFGSFLKNSWMWLLVLWGIKVIAKKRSSQSSGLPIFSINRDVEPKSRPYKDMSGES